MGTHRIDAFRRLCLGGAMTGLHLCFLSFCTLCFITVVTREVVYLLDATVILSLKRFRKALSLLISLVGHLSKAAEGQLWQRYLVYVKSICRLSLGLRVFG